MGNNFLGKNNWAKLFTLEDADLLDIGVRVKQTQIVEYCDSTALFIKARGKPPSERDRLSKMAEEKFKKCLQQHGDDPSLLCNYSFLLDSFCNDVEGSRRMLERSIRAQKTARGYYYYAQHVNRYKKKYSDVDERDKKFDNSIIELNFENALEINPHYANALKDYGQFLMMTSAEKIDGESEESHKRWRCSKLKRAEELLNRALISEPNNLKAMIQLARLKTYNYKDLYGGINEMMKCIALYPNDMEALIELLHMLKQQLKTSPYNRYTSLFLYMSN